MTRYISVTDTAKLIRDELKAKFAGVKFSVKSSKYSGGASIRIYWIDGPATELVKSATYKFEGSTFDGMQDLKEYKNSTLNGEAVSFGADYIFTERSYSDAMIEKGIDLIYSEVDGFLNQKPTLADYKNGTASRVECGRGYSFGYLVSSELEGMSA
jgi:hypothetical protein